MAIATLRSHVASSTSRCGLDESICLLRGRRSCTKILHRSWGWIVFDDTFHFSFISLTIFLEEIVSVCLSRRFGVGFIEKLLNPKEDLLDGDGRFPAFFFIKDRQTDRSRGIHIWVK